MPTKVAEKGNNRDKPLYIVMKNHKKSQHRPQATAFKTSGNKRFIPPHQLEEEINQIGDTKKGNNISSAAEKNILFELIYNSSKGGG